jgi:seryl-tRNA synthetase
MLEPKYLKDERNRLEESLNKRNFSEDQIRIIDEILSVDQLRKDTQSEADDLKARFNHLSKEIGELYKKGSREEAEVLKEKNLVLKDKIKFLNEKLKNTELKREELLISLPNVLHPSVPQGSGEKDNEIFKSGSLEAPSEDHNYLPHWELAQKFELIDFELGADITGSGFPVYVNYGARLQRALISYFLDQAREAGYREYQLPLLVNEQTARGTGQLPDKDGQMYHIERDDLYLIPTAEVPLTNICRGRTISSEDLPLKLTGYTPCFRREAGSYGAHVKGLNRLHQFDKVEIVQVRSQEDSYEALHEMVNYVETLIQNLGLPYRILRLCGGDTGFTSALTFDFEVFSAGQNRWLEVSSVSNFETFQSNRLKLKIIDGQGSKMLAHTLNGSALALPRIFASLIEMNQKENQILIPQVLQPYTGFSSIEMP